MLLAGDIGGTKTKLAIFAEDKGLRAPVVEETFPSNRYPSLEALAQEFLSHHPLPIERASFGVAGPVIAGKATITNLPWVMDETHLQETLQIPAVYLLNDLDAIAHSVVLLEPGEVCTLSAGQSVPHGNIAVIAPGTGLGEAFLTWNGSSYKTHTSEGGHCSFAPSNELEIEMLRFLWTKFEHVSYERVCSGIGIPNIYTFLKASKYAEEPSWLAQQLLQAQDGTPYIVNAALAGTSKLCVETLNIFVSALASETGNLALKVLSTAGIYVGGGIPPRILPILQDESFMRAFFSKGRFLGVLESMPVHVILNPEVALLGAAAHGLEMERDSSRPL